MTASSAIAILTMIPGVAVAHSASSALRNDPVIAIHLVNRAGIAAGELRSVKRALIIQINRDLNRFWHGASVRFAPAGWKVTIEPTTTVYGYDGAHGVNNSGKPYALVSHSSDWTVALSHELLEMLTNPYLNRTIDGRLVEICDPVQTAVYLIGQVSVSDFVSPAWYRTSRRVRAGMSWTTR